MWAYAIFLMMLFFFNPTPYQAFKESGAACVYNQPIDGVYATDAKPACWYDPDNTN